jgi:hypothetical protein
MRKHLKQEIKIHVLILNTGKLKYELKHLCTKKPIHKPNSGLDLLVRKPKIQKVKEKKKKLIINVENIGPNKIVVYVLIFFLFLVLNATFNNISAISW